MPRQNLPKFYFQTRGFRVSERSTLLAGSVSGQRICGLLIDKNKVVDIDEIEDFHGAKIKIEQVRTQLCLGTAKFDNHEYGYGSSLVPDPPSVLLDTANKCQVGWVDTSPRYGKSEFIIGNELRNSHDFCISSKIDGLVPSHHQVADIINDSVKLSLKTLKIEMLI